MTRHYDAGDQVSTVAGCALLLLLYFIGAILSGLILGLALVGLGRTSLGMQSWPALPGRNMCCRSRSTAISTTMCRAAHPARRP